jgi:hypothetical protein
MTKNKVQNRGVFFTTTKATTNSPRFTIQSPQIHQQKNTQKPTTPL